MVFLQFFDKSEKNSVKFLNFFFVMDFFLNFSVCMYVYLFWPGPGRNGDFEARPLARRAGLIPRPPLYGTHTGGGTIWRNTVYRHNSHLSVGTYVNCTVYTIMIVVYIVLYRLGPSYTMFLV